MFDKIDFEKLVGVEKKSDPRFIDFLTFDPEFSNVIILGYPDDEGIQNNGGRVGASQAPDIIRKFFYKMRPSILDSKKISICDLGNLKLNTPLSERHELGVQMLSSFFKQEKLIISFGGGHDYGYVDGKGFLESFKNSSEKPLIINFDAHFDVRNLDSGITSGTPFFRLLENYDFDFVEIGIQEQCNTHHHYEYLKSKGGLVLFLNDLYKQGRFKFKHFSHFFEKHNIKNRPCFVSVDIDAFSNAYAPGCSQSFSLGLEPVSFFTMLDYITAHNDVRNLGLYEVSPPLDIDDHTSKLAALIAYKFIYFSTL